MAILTVYTELLDNTLSGARIIDMGTQRSCACFVLPKDKVAEVGAKHKWVKQHAFYILLGVHPTTGKRMGYIGETNDFTHRVLDHKQKKVYWDTALVFISKSNEIYKSEVKYLEYLGLKTANEAGNYEIDNTKKVEKETLSPHKENEMNSFFEDIMFLTRFYGCTIFDAPDTTVFTDLETPIVFTYKQPNINALATLHYFAISQRYVIKKGSSIKAEGSNTGPKIIQKLRSDVIGDKKRSEIKGKIVDLLQDVEMPTKASSPSAAGSFCCGSSCAGTEAWKDQDEKTYPSEWWKGEPHE